MALGHRTARVLGIHYTSLVLSQCRIRSTRQLSKQSLVATGVQYRKLDAPGGLLTSDPALAQGADPGPGTVGHVQLFVQDAQSIG